tara:strand:- start:407 stop:955 length:549 start_codon:yes stop_codon:yes gene_type:complete
VKLTKITNLNKFKVEPVIKPCRRLENKTRMTIQGKRYRVGNPNHPHYKLYKRGGFHAVFKQMGLVDIKDIQKEVEALYNQYISGHLYVLSNPAWKGWHKVGMAVDAHDRCAAYQTSSPFRDYKIEYFKSFEDRRAAEKEAHVLLEQTAKERRGEWFKISVLKIKEQLETIKGELHDPINISI